MELRNAGHVLDAEHLEFIPPPRPELVNGGTGQSNAIALDEEAPVEKEKIIRLYPGEETFVNAPINFTWILDVA